MLGISIYLIFNTAARKATFSHYGKTLFFIFSLYSALIALIRDNYIGFGCSIGFFALFMINFYVRREITGDIFQKGLDISCAMCWLIFFIVFCEKLIYSHQEGYRCVGWFFNSNYLCTLMALMITVCVYKMLITQKGKPFYFITTVLCFITAYLGGSIFAFFEIIVGVFTLLILFKKRSVIAFFFALLSFAVILLYAFPEIFPRILDSSHTTDNRILIWDSALKFIKINPVFGQGFLGYHHLHEIHGSLWEDAHHTHNFLFEVILNFGIFGSLLLISFLWSYYEKVAECKSLLRKTKTANLILAISAQTVIHCTVDMTIQWIQTGLLFVLILAGIGVDEKTLNRRIKACLAKSEKSHKSSEEENQNG